MFSDSTMPSAAAVVARTRATAWRMSLTLMAMLARRASWSLLAWSAEALTELDVPLSAADGAATLPPLPAPSATARSSELPALLEYCAPLDEEFSPPPPQAVRASAATAEAARTVVERRTRALRYMRTP